MAREVKTGKILKNDYFSLLLLMVCGMSALMPVFPIIGFIPRRGGRSEMIDPEQKWFFILFMGGCALLAIGLCGWLAYRRIKRVRRILESGQEISGKVVEIWFQKDRGRIEYEYELDGQHYRSGNAIWKNQQTKGLSVDSDVTLIVDPEKPARAFIASLYLS